MMLAVKEEKIVPQISHRKWQLGKGMSTKIDVTTQKNIAAF